MSVEGREWRWVAWATLALVIASSLPYLIAWAATPEGARFTGLLFNPQDGNSYIAKMRQGLAGSWRFRLPYTPEPHDGAPVYLFYLLLGQAARWAGLPLILVYHGARVVGGAAMLLAFYALAARLSDEVGERRVMFLLTALGSGFGWLAGPLGLMIADLWIPEAFPSYALLANAHFPLAMGLMAGIACCVLRVWDAGERRLRFGVGAVAAAAALGMIQPFGLATVFGGLGAALVARAARGRPFTRRAAAWVAVIVVAALPYPLYTQWALHADPVLAEWSSQNVTPSPPVWDWALSYGIVFVLAALGCTLAVRRGREGDWLLLGWVAATVGGMYLPLPLQRRLSIGLGVPLGLLAGMGWRRGVRPRIKPRLRALARGLVVTFCALTPLFLALVTLLAALAGEPWFYLSDGEWAALEWLRDEGRSEGVVLCAPQMGLFVPAWAGQPVVYGHPFETVDAERRLARVEAYWAGEMSQAEREVFLRENEVTYALIGPRERAIGEGMAEPGGLVFEAQGVKVYEVTK